MPKTRLSLRSSRRVETLQDADIDHEILIIDHDVQTADPEPQASRPSAASSTKAAPERPDDQGDASNGVTASDHEHASKDEGPSIVINQPTPNERGAAARPASQSQHIQPHEPDTAIDILYQNERGGILCGVPLFSAAALGNLDPPAWTNFAHKPSPTDIHTAQVPDPSWQWAWPEWRINRDETIDTDAEGWEYSFMFSKKFSWHGPKWYNSFVRRRAWIRRRVRKGVGYQANDPHLMNEDYFQVTPKQKPDVLGRAHSLSRTSSIPEEKPDILLVEDLMVVLRLSRIDREKLEAVENYIKHSEDDLQLDQHMHEIMSVFVFQASRKLLLTRLMQVYDDLTERKGKDKAGEGDEPKVAADDEVRRKKSNLADAIKHADEEVRKLEYWSDIKTMAENGQSSGAVESGKGWKQGWVGLDNSGPIGSRNEELPTTKTVAKESREG
ncbi:uncharacterized protein B0I36DRAFT_248351 [Microdochium trichocladiopsis]|uniref:Meiotically up-regulated 65 protein n=1 Tax=Microdochium trichocladiopsis TaxID=1682393 RepID=A0A9P9BML8_9PEZI|nr:uncharacterized protein B0I36DRAFT_248351 [Microdochium trichocladiopsis]KAH7026410.1 hypothetical protein B0I36DRAFT_248351 [Microdochium trichocladiopsis]